VPSDNETVEIINVEATVSITGDTLVGSVMEVADKVAITPLADGLAGAVYVVATPLNVEVGETEPHGALGQVTLHDTPMFAESLLTTAVILSVAPGDTIGEAAETETLMTGGGGGGGGPDELLEQVIETLEARIALKNHTILGLRNCRLSMTPPQRESPSGISMATDIFYTRIAEFQIGNSGAMPCLLAGFLGCLLIEVEETGVVLADMLHNLPIRPQLEV
jgi:hypothetical protein